MRRLWFSAQRAILLRGLPSEFRSRHEKQRWLAMGCDRLGGKESKESCRYLLAKADRQDREETMSDAKICECGFAHGPLYEMRPEGQAKHWRIIAEREKVRAEKAEAEVQRLTTDSDELFAEADRELATLRADSKALQEIRAAAQALRARMDAMGLSIAPCGGSRCWQDSGGAWVHSSKSYSTCSVRAEAAKKEGA
jgi:hypothetical protein